SRVRDVEHAVYTDHSIPRRPAAARAVPADAPLIPFGGGEASDRELGLANASSAGIPLLEKAESEHPDDVPVLVQLGYLYDRAGHEEKAMVMYERALRLDPSQVTAAANLAGTWIKRGRTADAVRL